MAVIGRQLWFPLNVLGTLRMDSNTFTNFAVDSGTDALAFFFHAPAEAPLLAKCLIRCGALTGTSPVYVAALEGWTVGTDLNPDGTVKGGGSPASVTFTPVAGEAGTYKELTFANPYQTTAGEPLCLVIRHSSGTIDSSNNWSFSRAGGVAPSFRLPGTSTIESGTPTLRTSAVYAIGSASQWWGEGLWASFSVIEYGQNVRQGNLFTIPEGMGNVACTGAWAYGNYGITATAFLELYDSNHNLLRSVQTHPWWGTYVAAEWSPVELAAGGSYRIVSYRSDASSLRLDVVTFCGSAYASAVPWGNNVRLTVGAAGSWTDSLGLRATIGPTVDGITAPAVGGFTGTHQYIGLGR